jgi:hypothetical protein
VRVLRSIFLLAGLGLFLYLFVQLGPAAVLAMLGRIGWGALPVAAAYAAYQSLRAASLSASVPAGRVIPFRDALWIRLSGEAVQFLTFTGPFLAEPAKALLLRRRGLSAVEGFAATITEYLAYTITSAVLAAGALSYLLVYGELTGAIRTAAFVIAGIMVVFLVTSAAAIGTRTHLLGAILEWVASLPLIRRRLRPDMPAVHRMEDLLLDVMHDHPRRFARVLTLESASHVLHIVELFLILDALAIAAGIGTAVLIEGAAKFISLAFFFVPGQLGASEGIHALIFEAVGLPVVAGFTVPFIRRIRGVLVAALGLVAMTVLTRR